jgi:hypothetical protein
MFSPTESPWWHGYFLCFHLFLTLISFSGEGKLLFSFLLDRSSKEGVKCIPVLYVSTSV